MAFPSNIGTAQESLDSAWRRARSVADEIKTRSQSTVSLASAGTTSGVILDYATFLADKRQQLTAIASVSGLGAYAQSQIANPSLNVVTEFNSMTSAIDATVSWIIANFPKDANGVLLRATFSPDNSGRQTDRTFSAATLASFVTAVNSLLATIN